MFNQITLTSKGLFCPAGGFFIDPWKPVNNAVVTHAHADHLTRGCKNYYVSSSCQPLARHRLAYKGNVEGIEFGRTLSLGDAKVSLHPAGHVLGSAQVKVEAGRETWVISGDYKNAEDPTSEAFEQLECDVFVTEATFGLPIYKWPDQEKVAQEINDWWRENNRKGKVSLLCGYSLGKSQRLLSLLDTSIGKIYAHSVTETINEIYRAQGVALPEAAVFTEEAKREKGSLVLAPPASHGAQWTKGFVSGYASGWMTVRGSRARRAIDRGFVISDHADWPGLLNTIRATKAKKVLVTHGFVPQLTRYLKERGFDADALETQYGEEE